MIGQGWPSYAWSFPLEDGKANIGYGRRLTGIDGHGRDTLLAHLALRGHQRAVPAAGQPAGLHLGPAGGP